MSRTKIIPEEKIEHLSIVDATGKADPDLDPKLDDDLSLHLYKLMVLTRTLDERMVNMQRQGRVGTLSPCKGQEAVSCGAAPALASDDWFVPAFRETGGMLHRGWPIETLAKFWGGYEEGCVPPDGVNDLPIAVPVASQTLHAMGIAWGMKTKQQASAAMCFCGDGGTSEGDFHEAMNLAGAYNLPMVMVVVNNQWAISSPRELQTRSKTIAQKAIAYGFDGIQVDGNDILSVYVAAKEAVDKARSGGGPTLIEAVTYRMGVHTTADDPKKYRSDDEVKKWEKLDPISRYTKYLTARGLLTDQLIEQYKEEAVAKVAAGVEAYEAALVVDPLDVFDYMYDELPPELVKQREEFRQALIDNGYEWPNN